MLFLLSILIIRVRWDENIFLRKRYMNRKNIVHTMNHSMFIVIHLSENHDHFNYVFTRVILDSPVRSTLFTLDRQNSNQVSENSCAEAVPNTPPSEVVWSEQRGHVIKQKWRKAKWNKNFHKH